MNSDRKDLIRGFFSTLSPSDQREWLAHRRACDKSFFFFVKDVGGYMPKAGGDISPIIHKPICDSWQDRQILRQAAYLPRYWRKTTTLTEWSGVWEYLQDPELRYLIASEKADTASKWVMFIGNQILRNQRLRWLYPELQVIDASYIKTHRWSSLYLDLPHAGVYPEPTISITGIRGASQGGHWDIINFDDLVGEKSAESPVVLEDALRWFDNAEELLVQPDPSMPDASRVRIVGTHWGPGDFGEYVQEKYPEYKWFIVSCQKDESLVNTENITFINNPGVSEGESNLPELFSTKHYVDMAANPEKELVYWYQHRNNTKGHGGSPLNKFDYDWIRWYRLEDRPSEVNPDLMDKWIVCEDDKEEFRIGDMILYGKIDPGGFSEIKLVKQGSRNAILIGGQPSGSIKKFVVATHAARFKDPYDFMNILFGLHERWRVRHWKIESRTGAQGYIYKDILQEARTRKVHFPISEMEPERVKDLKDNDIQALITPAANGEIYIHRSMKELIAEWRGYPAPPKDLMDMLAKLYKQNWTRRKPEEIKMLNRMTDGDALEREGVSSFTGY